MFREFSHVEIMGYGNRGHVIWKLLTLGYLGVVFLNVFNRFVASFGRNNITCPNGYVLFAVK